MLLFSRLANEWASGSLHTQQQLANVWGDPVFASEHDLIIPPAWDTDGKIRAVADASALDFDYLVASYAWGECEVESPAPLPHQEYEHRITASAQEAKERFETDRESWLASLQLKVDNLNRSHDHASVAQPDPTDVTNVEPPQSDFFQRLLAKGRI